MNQRSFLLIGFLVLALAGVSLVVFCNDDPGALEQGGDPIPETEIDEQQPAAPLPGKAEVAPTKAEIEIENQLRSEGATTGIISGSIALDVSTLKQLHAYQVILEEEINPNSRNPEAHKPYRRVENYTYEGGRTPTFHLENVPFTTHGYFVQVYAKGLNGSGQRVHVNEQKPFGRVRLAITPGVLFSAILKDQRQNPLPKLLVQLLPEGTSTERFAMRATTNNYGVALFEGVVAGDYKLHVGETGSPRIEPRKVQIFATNPIHYDRRVGKVQVQTLTIVVPRGRPITIEVFDTIGHGVEGVDIDMHQIETSRFFRYQDKTDRSGRHTFPHVPLGNYQVSVSKPGHSRRTQKIYLKKEDQRKVVRIKLR